MTQPRYTPETYVARRTQGRGRTLLVEGPDDQDAALALVSKLARQVEIAPIDVDTAEIIEAVPGVLSNREKVEYVHRLSVLAGFERLAGLVDREFRWFSLFSPLADLGSANVERLYITSGHSLENYWFSAEYFIAFAELCCPGSITSRMRRDITSHFDDVRRVAAAWSLTCFRTQLLEKAKGIVRLEDWDLNSGRPEPSIAKLRARLGQRQIEMETLERVEYLFHRYVRDLRLFPGSFAGLLCHPHCSFDVLWTGGAAVLAAGGLPRNLARLVALPDAEWRRRFMIHIWVEKCIVSPSMGHPQLISWLSADGGLSAPRNLC